jgi:hypothetical protein
MHQHSFLAAITPVLSVAGLLALHPPCVRAESATAPKVTVGIFSRARLVQTFYRSEIWKATMQAKILEQNQAVTAGDAARADQIDREINAMQALAQKQVTGEAPLKNILDVLKADWPAIAKESGVDLIVEAPLYQAMGAGVVDVTPSVVRCLQAKKAP